MEGAGGQQLPYSGYVEASISLPGLLENICCLMLVVPDTHNEFQLFLAPMFQHQ
jgi:hypothetical protein